MSKQPPPAPTASAVGPCPTIIQIVGRSGTGIAIERGRYENTPRAERICNQSAEGAGGLGITGDKKLGESE